MIERDQIYINGAWVPSTGTDVLTVVNQHLLTVIPHQSDLVVAFPDVICSELHLSDDLWRSNILFLRWRAPATPCRSVLRLTFAITVVTSTHDLGGAGEFSNSH